MKTKQNTLLILLGLLCITATGFSQILRPFSVRYNNPSVRGNIVYVSNNIITTSGVAGTNETPPGGTSTNNGAGGVNIDVTGTSLIPFNSSWKYWANTAANYQNNWQTTAYSDAAWPAGNGQLGFGDGDEVTCIPYGCGGNVCFPSSGCSKYTATYFRKTVNIPSIAAFGSFILNAYRDDGIVVYVNGTEVWRDNMPTGAVAYATLATAAASDDGNGLQTITLPSGAPFVNGNNVIAVEVHQNSATSSDLTFDMQLVGSTAGIFNATTSDLSLPTCSQVLFAGLYWGAGQGTSGTNTSWITGETTCKIKIPGAASYTNITSTQTDYFNATLIPGYVHTGYMCFANITALVNSNTNPNGTYTLANVVGATGINDAYGGWTIVIAYSNPTLPTRNLTVFDGNAGVKSGSGNVDVNITGFLTPPTGPVSCELGTVAYDGDRGSADAYAFQQNGAPGFYDLTPTAVNPTSNANDMWNSTISYKGAVVTTRNPAHQNTLGYDADIIDLPNTLNAQLSNSQTAATVRFSSPSENYLVQVVTTSISQYNPSFNMDKASTDVNGGSLVPGDVLRYQITYNNLGNDASAGSAILDNIPVGTSYVAGSITIGGVSKTDAAGDDEAEYDFVNNRVVFRIGTGANSSSGGVVNSGVSGNVRFDVRVGSSCAFFSCGHTTSNSARINYTGQTSGFSLYDSSGTTISGCFTKGPVTNNVSGTCYTPLDTVLVNICPSLTVTLPSAKYIGYRFYSAMPFNAGNLYNPATPVSTTRTYFAFFDSGTGCSDTVKISVFINTCPDIDDDNDGIPDYVEINNPLALQDANLNGIPNWKDATYPGYVDNNSDGFNDNFDPAADSDNDGIPNYADTSFPGFTDANGDGVNDTMDKDNDGIPNNFDLDSDNDGIPDVVESGGVDANGDGRIDGYTDTDNDGFSQNVDANNTGILGSGNGLGAIDTDGDGVPNYLDKDSDNDGIPDVVEVYGPDANNDGRIDSFIDIDGDGFCDSVDGDVGNDGTAENAANCLLRTGPDANNNGRADSYTYNNMDGDGPANPYDLDSDGDGITDVKEGFPTLDANNDGRVDGTFNADGWSNTIAALGSLSLPNSDGSGRVNAYDIDSDNDGIPDDIEGLPTAAYVVPSGTDSDGDGLDNSYDNSGSFGGNGIPPVDTDGDGTPDYRDTDSDNDGVADVIEGNDFNLNGLADDTVTLTGIDTDGDGLDDRFDLQNSSASVTSGRMGNFGSFVGPGSPGSRTVVQRTFSYYTDRDWRTVFVLSCRYTSLKAVLQSETVRLDWSVLCSQEVGSFTIEKSSNGTDFSTVKMVQSTGRINETTPYTAFDDVSNAATRVIYYRLVTIEKDGRKNISNTVSVILQGNETSKSVRIAPNPVRGPLQLIVTSDKPVKAAIQVVDITGKSVYQFTEKINAGTSSLSYSQVANLADGVYYLRVEMDNKITNLKFNKIK